MSNTKTTAAPAADTSKPSTKPAKAAAKAKPKAKAAMTFEQLVRDQWASTLRTLATDLAKGGEFKSIARQLSRLVDSIREASKAVAQ